MRKILILVVAILMGLAHTVPGTEREQLHKLTFRELFDRALKAKGDEYVKLRNAIIGRNEGAVPFLKVKVCDQDWRTAILAEAMLGRITDLERYTHYKELLIVPIKSAWLLEEGTVVGPRPFDDIRVIAKGQWGWRSRSYGEDYGEDNVITFDRALHQKDAIAFLIELGLKDCVREMPNVASEIPLSSFKESYTSEEVGEVLGVTKRTAERWCGAQMVLPYDESQKVSHATLRRFAERYGGRPRRFEGDKARAVGRCYAAIRLGRFEHRAITPALIELLKTDTCEYVRVYAAGQLRTKEALEPLLEALKDEGIEMRREAATSLGRIKDRRSIGPLTVALKHRYEKEEHMHGVVRKTIAVAIGEIDIDALVALMTEEDVRIREALTSALLEFEEAQAMEVFMRILREAPQSHIRMAAARKLGQTGDRRAVEALITALNDNNRNVRQLVAKALEKIGDFRAIGPLEAAAVGDKDFVVRNAARRAFQKLEQKKLRLEREKTGIVRVKKWEMPSLDSLIADLRDERPGIRIASAKALRRVKDPRAVEALVGALNDPDHEVRGHAAYALGETKESSCIKSLVGVLMEEQNIFVRQKIFTALQKMNDPSTVELLAKVLKHEKELVVWKAIRILSELKDPRAIKHLIAVIDDEEGQLRRLAARAITRISIDAGLRLFHDYGPEIKRAVTTEIWQGSSKGPGLLKILIAALRDEDPRVRLGGLVALRARKYAIGKDALISALSDQSPYVRCAVIEVLADFEQERLMKYVTGRLKDEDSSVRSCAAKTLGERKDLRFVGLLVEALGSEQDKGVQAELIKALAQTTGYELSVEEWGQWWDQNSERFEDIGPGQVSTRKQG